MNTQLQNLQNKYLKANQNDPHQASKHFFKKLDQLFDKHSPKKKITKKEQTSLPKPWITKGILNSIKVNNKTCTQFCKSTDPLKKNEFHIKSKTEKCYSKVNMSMQRRLF